MFLFSLKFVSVFSQSLEKKMRFLFKCFHPISQNTYERKIKLSTHERKHTITTITKINHFELPLTIQTNKSIHIFPPIYKKTMK